jgi:hypothetical protein
VRNDWIKEGVIYLVSGLAWVLFVAWMYRNDRYLRRSLASLNRIMRLPDSREVPNRQIVWMRVAIIGGIGLGALMLVVGLA